MHTQGGVSGTFFTIGSPATAKNGLSVGASVNSGTFDQVAYFSSHGPVSTDLRYKVLALSLFLFLSLFLSLFVSVSLSLSLSLSFCISLFFCFSLFSSLFQVSKTMQ